MIELLRTFSRSFGFAIPLLLGLALSGCGAPPAERSTAPVLTVSEFFLPEEEIGSFDILLFGGSGSIDGVRLNNNTTDVSDFAIDLENTSSDFMRVRVRQSSTFDFENPTDENRDNIYELELVIIQGGRETARPFTVTIFDIDEPGEANPSDFLIIGRDRGGMWGQKAMSHFDLDADRIAEVLVSFHPDSRRGVALELIYSSAILSSEDAILDLRTTNKTPEEVGIQILRRTRTDSRPFLDGINFDLFNDFDADGREDIVVSGYNGFDSSQNTVPVPEQAFLISSFGLSQRPTNIFLGDITADRAGRVGLPLLNTGGYEFGLDRPVEFMVEQNSLRARRAKVGNVFASIGDITGDNKDELAFCIEPEIDSEIPFSRVAIIDGEAITDAYFGRRGLFGIEITSVATTDSGVLLYDRNATAANPGHNCNTIAGIGDIDGDGVNDLAFGDTLGNQGASPDQASGEVVIVSGAAIRNEIADGGENYIDITGYSTPGVMVARNSSFPNRQFIGHSISPAGDLNRDGFNDFLIGAPGQIRDGQPSANPRPGEPGFRLNQGRVFIVYGRSNFFTAADGMGQRIFEMEPNRDPLRPVSILGAPPNMGADELGNGFGFSITVLDNVRGDEAPEIIVGSPFDGIFGRRPRSGNGFSLFEGSIFQNPGFYEPFAGPRFYRFQGARNPATDTTSEGSCNQETGSWVRATRRDFDRDLRSDLLFTAPCGDGVINDISAIDNDYGHVYLLRSRTIADLSGTVSFVENLFPLPPPP